MSKLISANLSDDVLETSRKMFKNKSESNWAIFKFEGDSNLVLDSADDGSKEKFTDCWNDFLNHLPSNEVRYGLTNFKYFNERDNIFREKLVFIMWVPEYALGREKMMLTVYSKDVQRQLSDNLGFQIKINADEFNELSYERVLNKIKKTCYCF